MAEASCFEVLDVFDGFTALTKRSPTLDGSVPVRVAQACVPLLEGNAYGFQVHSNRTLRVRRHLGLPRIEDAGVARLHDAALPRLLAYGLIEPGGAWHRALRRGFAWGEGVARRRPRLHLFTGLLVKPDRGVWLRVTGAANRRNTLVDVAEAVIPDDGAFVPLVLTLTLPAFGIDRVRLQGEIACLAPVEPGVRVGVRDLAEAPDVGLAHVRFYDQHYFEAKKTDVTGKYRRLVAQQPTDGAPAPVTCEVVSAGPARLEVANVDAFTTTAGPKPERRPRETRRLESVVFRNAVAFRALFDGHTLALDHDAHALAAAAGRVEAAWAEAYGADFIEAHRGALWYLTKYFTPHPPGEPHFFVKPWALTRTPPGWSCLLEGIHGDGYDVLRGVVSTDVFHATPAVFRVHREGAPISVGDGAPLLRAIPVPRRLMAAGFRVASLSDSL